MSENAARVRYCTGCCQEKQHSLLWLGTYCLRCRAKSIPRRWSFFVRAWAYDVMAGRR